jgi:hypothetical protein
MERFNKICLIVNWVYLIGLIILIGTSIYLGRSVLPTIWMIVVLLGWGLLISLEYFIEALMQIDEMSKLMDTQERMKE